MPSHRSDYPGTALQLHTLLPFAKTCTPRTDLSFDNLSYPQTPQVDASDSSLRVSGQSAGECRPSLLDVQQPSERRMGAADDVDMDTLLQLGDLQEWWPHIGNGSEDKPSISTDINLPNQHGCEDRPSNVVFMHDLGRDEQTFDLQSWCAPSNGVQSLSKTTAPKPLCITPKLNLATAVEPLTPTIESAMGEKGAPVSPPANAGDCTSTKISVEKHLGVQKKWTGKRPVSQRESHIWSERQRRKGMNHLFSTLRSLLPQPTSKTDKSTVVSEIINYIKALQLKLESLSRRRAQVLASRCHRTAVLHPTENIAKPSPSNGRSLAEVNTVDSIAITALAPLQKLPGAASHQNQSESCLQSFLGANVGLHICGSNAFITISSPRGQRGLFQRILVTLQNHQLDVVNANISTSKASIFHCLHVQAAHGAELPKEELLTAIQSVITTSV